MIKATNIDWDVDMDEVYEKLDELSAAEAAEALEIQVDTYANMTTTERHDYAYTVFRHRPGLMYDFLSLPEEVEITEEMEEDDVVDYLSDKYGYCINFLSIACESTKVAIPDNSCELEIPFTVACTAVYHSSIKVPGSLKGNHEEILKYVQSHLDEAPVNDLEWISDLEPEDAVMMEDIKDFGDTQEVVA